MLSKNNQMVKINDESMDVIIDNINDKTKEKLQLLYDLVSKLVYEDVSDELEDLFSEIANVYNEFQNIEEEYGITFR